MLNLLPLIVGLVAITLLARYNKSNKLFWIFLTAFITGFTSGSVYSRLTTVDEKKDGTTIVVPTHSSSTLTVIEPLSLYATLLEETHAPIIWSNNVSLEHTNYNKVVPTLQDKTNFNPDSDIGLSENYYNTS